MTLNVESIFAGGVPNLLTMDGDNPKFADSGTTQFDPVGYDAASGNLPAVGNPFSLNQGTLFTLIAYGFFSGTGSFFYDQPFTLSCSGSGFYLDNMGPYDSTDFFGNFDNVFVWNHPNQNLKSQVYSFSYSDTIWTANIGGVTVTQNVSAGPNAKVYVLWNSPLPTITDVSNAYQTNWGQNIPTLKRTDWAVNAAANEDDSGASSVNQIVTNIFDTLTSDGPPYTGFGSTQYPSLPFTSEVWTLMDGQNEGACNQLSALMAKALGVVGVVGEVHYLRAQVYNDKPTLVNVEAMATQWMDPVTGVVEDKSTPGAQEAWLIMDFSSNAPTDFNATWAFPGDNIYAKADWNCYEGCCFVPTLANPTPPSPASSAWYTIWPEEQAQTSYGLFELLPFTQYWCITTDGSPPTSLPPTKANPNGTNNFQQIYVANWMKKP